MILTKKSAYHFQTILFIYIYIHFLHEKIATPFILFDPDDIKS